MTIASLERPASAGAAARSVPLWAWWLVAVATATALALLAKGIGRTFEFIDSDDALRFVQVRELLAGAAWFPVKTGALGGAEDLVSHWSRLVDAPLALLLGLMRLLVSEPMAHKAAVTIWPVLLLGGMLWAIGRASEIARGRDTALLALVLGSLSLLGYYQFAPGRIDHHSAMIVTTVTAALIMWAAPQSARAWRWAGALAALALAVGYEALAPVALLAAIAGACGLLDRRMAAQAGCFAIGLAATLAVALAVTVPPSHWLTIHCDALSLNIVALAGAAATGFVLVMRHGEAWSWARQAGVLVTGGGLGVLAFGMLEPACLAGPMGQLPKALWPIWMEHVEEARSLVGELMRGKVSETIGAMVILTVGLGTAASGLARSERPADRLLLAATTGFVVLALWQQKYLAYASFILAPGVAVAIMRLPGLGSISAPAVRVLALIILNQFALYSLAMSLKGSVSRAAAVPNNAAAAVDAAGGLWSCTTAEALRALDQVPPGLVVAHNDIGAHLVAYTHHRALSGPYHRIPTAIIDNEAILKSASVAEAGRLLGRHGARYVLSCAALDERLVKTAGWKTGLVADLASGQTPPYLVAVPLQGAPMFRLWEIDGTGLPTR